MIIYVIETAWVTLPPSEEERLFKVSNVNENVAQRIRLARTVREVSMKNGKWRQRVDKWWDKQRGKNEDVPEIPLEVRQKWEAEARSWVDAKIIFE